MGVAGGLTKRRRARRRVTDSGLRIVAGKTTDHCLTGRLALTYCIAPTICHLCNLSIETGEFPIQLKQAHVLPKLKKNCHWILKHLASTDPFLIFRSFPKLLSELLSDVSLTIHPSSVFYRQSDSQHIVHITPLRRRSSDYTMI